MSDAMQVVREMYEADKKPWLALSDAQANALERVLAVASVPPCVVREVRALPLDLFTEAELYEVDAWLEKHRALTTTTEGE